MSESTKKVTRAGRAGLLESRSYFFELDKLTPTADEAWQRRVIKRLNIFDCPKLENRTRKELGYSKKNFEEKTGISLSRRNTRELFLQIVSKLEQTREILAFVTLHPKERVGYRELEGMLKVELAFCHIKLCYGREPRKSVDPKTSRRHLMRSHLLRSGLIAAFMGPIYGWNKYDNVVGDLLHDLKEDARDLPGVRFVLPQQTKSGGIKLAEIRTSVEQYRVLKMLYSDEISTNVFMVTRDKAKKYGHHWAVDFERYLSRRVVTRLQTQRTKTRDLINNGWEINTIVDKEQKKSIMEKIVLKMSMMAFYDPKISWFTTELLLRQIELLSKDPGCALQLRGIAENDLKVFEKGLVMVGKREFSWKLLKECPNQGSPVMIAYHEGRGHFLIEIPHLDGRKSKDVNRARKIVEKLIGQNAEIEQSQTLANPWMRRVVFFSFKGTKNSIDKNTSKAVELYDFYLKKKFPDAMEGGRKGWAERIRKGRYYPETKATEGTPPPKSAEHLEVLKRTDALRTFVKMQVAAQIPSFVRHHTKPLAEEPL